MSAKKCDKSESSSKSSTEGSETKNSKRLETRRRIEELFEEKRLRDELELDY